MWIKYFCLKVMKGLLQFWMHWDFACTGKRLTNMLWVRAIYTRSQSFSSLMANFSQDFKFYLHIYITDVHRRVLKIKLYEGNMFGSIMAFIRRCKDLYEICQANGQLFRFFSWNHFHEKFLWKWFVLLFVYILTMYQV